MKWNFIGKDASVKIIMPPAHEIVQLAVRDDSGDTTSYYVIAGWYLTDDIFISDNEIVHGEVYAWRPLDDVPYETRESCNFCTYHPELWEVYPHNSKDNVITFYKIKPKYCPECGRKLIM